MGLAEQRPEKGVSCPDKNGHDWKGKKEDRVCHEGCWLGGLAE